MKAMGGGGRRLGCWKSIIKRSCGDEEERERERRGKDGRETSD